MYVVLLAGGIGSGKSSAARELERLGCARIDLDQLSRKVLEPGSPTVAAVAEAFGADLLDSVTGELDRALLARRAFATPEAAAHLEAIELPAIRELLTCELARLEQSSTAPSACVVEVPLLDRIEEPHALAREIVAVTVPRDLRRERAIKRGMSASDFDARDANQPSDAWLAAHADTLISNEGTPEELAQALAAWYDAHERGGWR